MNAENQTATEIQIALRDVNAIVVAMINEFPASTDSNPLIAIERLRGQCTLPSLNKE
jgi:hypothetical protein